MIQYNFLTQVIKSWTTEYQNSNMEATSAFDLYCYNKQKVQKYVMLHPIWSDSLPQENMWCYTLSGQTVCHKKSSRLINHKCVKKRYFTFIAFAFVFIFYVTSNSSNSMSVF